MKTCSKCQNEKPYSDFHKSKASKTGYQAYCKVCTSVRLKEYKKTLSEDTITNYQKRYYDNNKEKCNLRCKQEYLENKAKHKEYGKTHYQKNRAEYLASSRYRKALLKQRVPSWLTDSDKKAIVEIYKEARRLTETTGIRHHVDHIVPLQGKTVSGFHVPWNLQILTAEENLRKNNKHEPDDFSASF